MPSLDQSLRHRSGRLVALGASSRAVAWASAGRLAGRRVHGRHRRRHPGRRPARERTTGAGAGVAGRAAPARARAGRASRTRPALAGAGASSQPSCTPGAAVGGAARAHPTPHALRDPEHRHGSAGPGRRDRSRAGSSPTRRRSASRRAISAASRPRYVDSLRTMAEGLAAQVRKTVVAPTFDAACFANDAGARTCADKFARDFGARAFRRPLDDREVTALLGVYDAGPRHGHRRRRRRSVRGRPRVRRARRAAVVALHLPHGAGRHRAAPTPRRSSRRTSSRARCRTASLASPPDATLVAAAAAGQLATPDQMGAQARRLMTQPARSLQGDRPALRVRVAGHRLRQAPSGTRTRRCTRCGSRR